MINYIGPRIVRTMTVEDGTTLGKKVFIDENGARWERTTSTRETCGTDKIITNYTETNHGDMWRTY